MWWSINTEIPKKHICGDLSILKSQRSTFALCIWVPQSAACWIDITNQEQKMAIVWCIWYFCHTHQPCLWCHRHRLLGTKWQQSQSHFCDFPGLIINRTWKLVETGCVYILFFHYFHFYRQDPWCFSALGHCFVPLYFSFNLKRQHFTHRRQAGGSWVRTWCGSYERSARGWPCATGPPTPHGGASRCTCCGRSSTGMVMESTCCMPSARCQTARSALARTGGRWCHLPMQQTLDVRLRLHVRHQHKCLKSLSNTL